MRDRTNRPRARRARGRPGVAPPPAAVRPAARRSGGGRAGETTRTSAPRPPGRITGRAVVLGVVLGALALSYVIPLRTYLRQQAEIAELEAAQSAQTAHIAELEAEAERWRDDDYIRIQARRRLHFGGPGEILIVTVFDDEAAAAERELAPGEAPEQPGAWWDTLWTSIESSNGAGG